MCICIINNNCKYTSYSEVIYRTLYVLVQLCSAMHKHTKLIWLSTTARLLLSSRQQSLFNLSISERFVFWTNVAPVVPVATALYYCQVVNTTVNYFFFTDYITVTAMISLSVILTLAISLAKSIPTLQSLLKLQFSMLLLL